MSKKLKTIRLSDEALEQLGKLTEAQDRSEGYIIDKLILSTKEKVAEKKKKV